MTDLAIYLLQTELSVYLPAEIDSNPDRIEDVPSGEQTELSVYLPGEISSHAEDGITEAEVPLLPASKIGSGVLNLDRIPSIPVSKIVWDDDGTEPVDGQDAETDSNIATGQPLYLKQNGHVALASAAAIGTARVCGLALFDAFAATSVRYSPDGVMELEDWTAVTDSAALAPGAVYFLSAEAGKLTTTAPTESGQVVLAVGTALSPVKLAIEIQQPFSL